MKKFSIALFALSLVACASGPRSFYFYNEILVVNNSNQMIRDVSIKVSGTGRVFSCGNIAPFGICSNRFGKRRYEMNPIQVGWTFGNTARQTGDFVVEVPATLYSGLAMRGVLAINPDGSIATYFEQDTPNN